MSAFEPDPSPGSPPAAPPGRPPAAPPGRPPARRRRWGRLLALAGAVGLLVVGLSFNRGDDGGPETPAEWDPRVRELVAFVEAERELTFEHPVPVSFLDDEEFDAIVAVDDGDLTDDDRESLRHAGAMLRSIGLADGDIDVLEQINELRAHGTLALYRPDSRDIVVNSSDDATESIDATLVHELTHALDDQHFDLGALREEADDESRVGPLLALIEGSAKHVENAYVEAMPRAARRAYEESNREMAREFDASTAGIPPVFALMLSSPYAFGPALVDVLLADGGRAAVDAAFADPPISEEQYMDPEAFVADDAPEPVERPALAPGDRDLDPNATGEFGMLGWYTMLAERVDPRAAWAALRGWGGDAYRVIEHDDRVCVVVAYRGEDDGATADMAAILDDWADAAPGTDARVEQGDDGITLTTCDPGTDARITTGDAETAFALPMARVGIIGELVGLDVPLPRATCIADGVVDEYDAEELGSSLPDDFGERIRAISRSCAAV